MADWRRLTGLLPLLLALSPVQAADKSFCFAMADSYYEQLYCEIQARGEGRTLPAFYQFQQNNEQTQALLLKRPAARLGIEVKAARRPQAKTAPRTATAAPLPVPAAPRPGATSRPTGPQAAPCQLDQRVIRCDNRDYLLLSNRHNRHLARDALGPDNRLSLPAFHGNYDDESAVRSYLYGAYERYLDRMHAIGLAGVSTSFGKFSYLFYDYRERGLNFTERFETLYHYLKKDKASLPVSETPADTRGLSLDQCAALSDRFYICQWRNQNLVFAADHARKQP